MTAPDLDAIDREALRLLAVYDAPCARRSDDNACGQCDACCGHVSAANALRRMAPDLAAAHRDALARLASAEAQRDTYRDDAHRLAAANGRLVDEADAAQRGRRAAEAQRDALAAAVREERDAADAYDVACAALDSDACAVASARMDAAASATDALLAGAAPDVVRAGVVRDFLRAHDRVPWAVACDGPQLEREAEARTALDAALAAAEGR